MYFVYMAITEQKQNIEKIIEKSWSVQPMPSQCMKKSSITA